MSFEFAHFETRLCVVDTNHRVVAAQDKMSSVGSVKELKGLPGMSSYRQALIPCFEAPDADRPVIPRRGQLPSVGRECDSVDFDLPGGDFTRPSAGFRVED